jgi:hypothetical protein
MEIPMSHEKGHEDDWAEVGGDAGTNESSNSSGSGSGQDESSGSLADKLLQVFTQTLLTGQQPVPEEEQRPGTITGEDWYDYAWRTPGQSEYNETNWNKIEDYEMGGGRARDLRPDWRRPQYSTEYPMQELQSMTSGEIAELELNLQKAGWIPESQQLRGLRSFALLQTFSSLVGEADFRRTDWADFLDKEIEWYQANGDGEDRKYQNFAGPSYLKPDYDTLAVLAKTEVRNRLGRKPSESEMELLTQHLSAGHRKQWQAREYDTELAEYNARARAYEDEVDTDAASVQDYDQQASFSEYFDEKYAGELAHRKRQTDTYALSQSLFGSLDMISRNL